MIDGTGETVYTYDQLDRMTESKDGHGDTVKYEYNLANEPPRSLTPTAKPSLVPTTKTPASKASPTGANTPPSFAYDPDSNLKSIAYPAATETSIATPTKMTTRWKKPR